MLKLFILKNILYFLLIFKGWSKTKKSANESSISYLTVLYYGSDTLFGFLSQLQPPPIFIIFLLKKLN